MHAAIRFRLALLFPVIVTSVAAQLAPAPGTISALPPVTPVVPTLLGPVAPTGASTPVVTVTAPTTPPVVAPPALPPTGRAEPPATRGETSITLDVGFGIRAVPASRLTVPVGESLRLTAPNIGEGFTYGWTKNGRAIPGGSDRALTIPFVTSSDAGTYVCLFLPTPTTLPLPSQSLVLGVGPTDRLLNLSTRLTIGSGPDQAVILGFVITAGTQPKKLIVRAIGPSLSLFGVTNPLRAPVLRIFDGSGKSYENGYAYPPVVGGPTYESDLADSLARAGSFPILAGTRDAVVMMPFVAGSYTAQISSGDGTAGTVLLELYEVP